MRPEDEIRDALRDLERQLRAPAPEPSQEVAEAVKQIAEEQREQRARRARRPAWVARLKWPAITALSLGVAVVLILWLMPEPPPPPASSPTEAVRSFWEAIIAGRYQAATAYCPSLVDKYGSPEQAARYLRQQFQANPVVLVRNIQLADSSSGASGIVVNYEVIRRTGSPLTGQAVVVDTGDPKRGFVITGGI